MFDLDEPCYCQVLMFDSTGKIVSAGESEGVSPNQLAHMSLHADGVVCVRVSVLDGPVENGGVWVPVVERCDPGVDFAEVVADGALV